MEGWKEGREEEGGNEVKREWRWKTECEGKGGRDRERKRIW